MINVAIRSNLRVLHSQKEAAEARRIPYKEVHEATGVAESTISALMNNRVTMFHADTIEKLCDYYSCEPGDLIIRVPDRDVESVAA